MNIFTITVRSNITESATTRVRSKDRTVEEAFTTDWSNVESNSWSILRGYGLSTVDRAVQKLYGKNCFFHQDSGLPLGYGQIFRPVKSGGSTSVTGSIRIEVTEGAL